MDGQKKGRRLGLRRRTLQKVESAIRRSIVDWPDSGRIRLGAYNTPSRAASGSQQWRPEMMKLRPGVARIIVSAATVICAAAGVGWLMLPPPGRAIYDEMRAASHNPGSIAVYVYQFRTWVPVQQLLTPRRLRRGFMMQINGWKVLLPSIPIQIAMEPRHEVYGLPKHLKVTARVHRKWFMATMCGMPRFTLPPEPVPRSLRAPASTALLPPRPHPGFVQVVLGDFYTTLPRDASGVRIDGVWTGQKLKSVNVEYADISYTWLHRRRSPLLRRLVRQYAVGHGFYESVIWWGLVHAGTPPWRASHVIASAAMELLKRPDLQLMRMAFCADVSQLPRAATSVKAVRKAILAASVSVAGHEVFWARTPSEDDLCFWLRDPYTVMVKRFDRAGRACADTGFIEFARFAHAGPFKFVPFGLDKARQWGKQMRNTVETGLPFFVAGPPGEDIHATEESKD